LDLTRLRVLHQADCKNIVGALGMLEEEEEEEVRTGVVVEVAAAVVVAGLEDDVV